MGWILAVMVAGSWLVYPNVIASKEECEQGYEIVAKTFEDNKETRPPHICGEIVNIPEDKQQ